MRTQLRLCALCVVVAGTGASTSGCDDLSAGRATDSSAPPQLVHALVQDARYFLAFPNRGSVLDLLDNNLTRTCMITQPATSTSRQIDTCLNEFLVDQLAPDVHCTPAGVCNDAIKVPPTGIPVPASLTLVGAKPDNRDPGGGIQIRLVFDKVLDESIEAVSPSGSTAPGLTDAYALVPGIVELDDGAGKAVASVMYYDNGGSHEYSADLELEPLGPAVVIKPTAPLAAATTYTIKFLQPGALKDRDGHAAAALGGGTLPSTLTFTTETLTPTSAGAFRSDLAGGNGFDFPNFAAGAALVAPNDVVQIGFFEAFAGDSATVTIKKGCAGARPIAYSERGSNGAKCTKADPGGYPVLDVVNSDTGSLTDGKPADWPMGDCTLTVTVPDAAGKSSYSADYTFTVNGADETDSTVDPNIASQHVTPAECVM